MKLRKTHTCVNKPDEPTRASQLSKLRELLDRVKSRPGMGELTLVLRRMLDAGQVVFECVRRGRKAELVFAARVTPEEIRELLPLVRHPVPYGILRFFLERMIYIAHVTGGETELEFCNSDEMRRTSEAALPGRIWRSGVPDPEGTEETAKQSAAEMAVVTFLGVPFRPEPDGWLNLYIGDKSVEIRQVQQETEHLSYPRAEEFRKDIAVVVLPLESTRTVRLIGWVDRETFAREHRKILVGNTEVCVLDQRYLRPMNELKQLARQSATLTQ